MANLSNINNKFLVTTGGNVGIATTSPGAKLDVNGATYIRNVLFTYAGGGNQYAGLSWNNPDNGFLFLKASNVTKVNINSSGDSYLNGGNVGIGSTTPNFKLDIVNAAVSTATYMQFRNGTTGTTSSDGTVVGIDADGDFLINNQEAKEIKLYTSDTQRLTIQSGGNVGIGTTSPNYKLTVADSTANGRAIQAIQSATSGTNWGFQGGAYGVGATKNIGLQITAEGASTNYAALFTGGNVGIGTTTPQKALHIEGASGASASQLLVCGPSDTTGDTAGILLRAEGGEGDSALRAKGGIFFERNATGNGLGSLHFCNNNSNNNDSADLTDSHMTILGDGKVGIGTTSPDTKLQVLGTSAVPSVSTNFQGGIFSIEGTSTVYLDMGTTGSPGYYAWMQAHDASNGVNYKLAINPLGGNVGIGTDSPDYKLEVESTSDADLVSIKSTAGANNTQMRLGISGNDSVISGTGGSSGNLVFKTYGSERMRINTSGNVGIGETNPSSALEVVDSTNYKGIHIRGNAAPNLTFGQNLDSTAEWKIGISGFNGDSFSIGTGTGANDKLHITNTGNVGIATTSPEEKLHVVNAANASVDNFILELQNTTTVADSRSGILFSTNSSTGANRAGCAIQGSNNGIDGTGHLLFGSVNSNTFSEKMRITSGGNVGIGHTTPQFGLTMAQGTGDGSRIGWEDASNFKRASIICSSSTDALQFHTGTSDTERMRVTSAGDVGIGKTNPSTHLDVQGVITCGDSTTDGAIRRQHQTFATMKPGPSSGGSVDMMFVDHTHSLDITVVAYINTSNVATGRGYSVSAYGSATAGLSQTQLSGNISALSISYVNTGGSENYILRVTCTYSGATAPVISVTASGQSTSELRAAT